MTADTCGGGLPGDGTGTKRSVSETQAFRQAYNKAKNQAGRLHLIFSTPKHTWAVARHFNTEIYNFIESILYLSFAILGLVG
jgi:hypothetical protein